MRAAVNTRYGSPDVIEIREVARPVPKAGEVLVKVHATTVNRTDCGVLRAHPFPMRLFTGLLRPKRTILGMDFAGVVETVGADVQSFRPGDHVFGLLRMRELGAHAEYVCVPEAGYIAGMPAGVTFEHAVVGEGAFYAYASLMQLGLKRGQRILIYGASGAIGTAAVQLAILLNYKCADFVGHKYGPESEELRVTLAEIDRQLARVLRALEAKVGKNYLLAVTADHGMPSLPPSPDHRHFVTTIARMPTLPLLLGDCSTGCVTFDEPQKSGACPSRPNAPPRRS